MAFDTLSRTVGTQMAIQQRAGANVGLRRI
jgi:hypothetical protein